MLIGLGAVSAVRTALEKYSEYMDVISLLPNHSDGNAVLKKYGHHFTASALIQMIAAGFSVMSWVTPRAQMKDFHNVVIPVPIFFQSYLRVCPKDKYAVITYPYEANQLV